MAYRQLTDTSGRDKEFHRATLWEACFDFVVGAQRKTYSTNPISQILSPPKFNGLGVEKYGRRCDLVLTSEGETEVCQHGQGKEAREQRQQHKLGSQVRSNNPGIGTSKTLMGKAHAHYTLLQI
jgi:hypothetical protein